MKELKKDKLTVKIYGTRKELGSNAGKEIVAKIRELLSKKDEINIIFAAAPSQNEALETLKKENIRWEKINAFHMDEYIGLPDNVPQKFGNFLKKHIFDCVNFKSVHLIGGENEKESIENYEKILSNTHIDIVCMGIGENGHIAFNDPPVADFNDKKIIKKVKLDEICRQQQVNDKCFENLDDVPKYALTLTVPTLFNADYLFCVVPGSTKKEAVFKTLNNDINEKCPSTILRCHNNAILYCDKESFGE